jgi:hypothetical protein
MDLLIIQTLPVVVAVVVVVVVLVVVVVPASIIRESTTFSRLCSIEV